MPNRHYRELPVRDGRFLRDGRPPAWRWWARRSPPRTASRVGGTLTLEGEPYEIVGVLDRMLTAPDRFVIVPIEDARAQWVAKDPLLRTALASGGVALQASDLNTGAAVGWRDGEDPGRGRPPHRASACPSVNVADPERAEPACSAQSTAFFSALLVGIGALGARHRRALARQHGGRRRLRAHPRLRRQARARRHAICSSGARCWARRSAVTLTGGRVGVGVALLARAGRRRLGRAHRPAALPVLAAAARRRARRSRCCSARRRPDVRDAARRAPVAGRSDPPRRLRLRGEGLVKSYRAPGGAPHPRARCVDLACSRTAASRRGRRPVGLGQEHAAERARSARRRRRRRRLCSATSAVSALGRVAREPGARPRSVGFVFQSFLLLALAHRARQRAAGRALCRADGPDGAGSARASCSTDSACSTRRDHYPAQLSGGEQQRVAFCRAVLNDPPLLAGRRADGQSRRRQRPRHPGRAAGRAPGAAAPWWSSAIAPMPWRWRTTFIACTWDGSRPSPSRQEDRDDARAGGSRAGRC